MQRFLILALCFAVSDAASVHSSPFTVGTSSIFTPKGVVGPITRCGGVGTFVQLRVSDCDGVCNLEPGTKYEIELDFVLSSAMTSLSLKLSANVKGSEVTILDTELESPSVDPSFVYTIYFALTPNDILSGRTIQLTSRIRHTDIDREELCISNSVNIN